MPISSRPTWTETKKLYPFGEYSSVPSPNLTRVFPAHRIHVVWDERAWQLAKADRAAKLHKPPLRHPLKTIAGNERLLWQTSGSSRPVPPRTRTRELFAAGLSRGRAILAAFCEAQQGGGRGGSGAVELFYFCHSTTCHNVAFTVDRHSGWMR